MKTRVLLLILALVLSAVPAFAQNATPANTVSYNGFSFSFSRSLATTCVIFTLVASERLKLKLKPL